MNLDALYKSLNTAYDPQRQSIATQQQALPSFYNAQRTGLEQARTNAFKDISTQANTRGGYFSGFAPDAQAQYTGSTYIPAMGNIANAQSTANQSLLDQLNQINAQQTTQASGLFQTVQDRAQQQKQWEQGQLANQTQWQQQQTADQANFERQLQANRENASISASSATPTVVNPYEGFNAVTNKASNGSSAGTSFYGPGNQPITAGQYYQSTGTGLQGLTNFLRNDDQGAYKDLITGTMSYDDLTKKYPWIFGGS